MIGSQRVAWLGIMVTASAMSWACNRTPAVEPATLVLRGGKIVTVDAAMPEAQAIAIRGDRIAAVGTNDAASQPYIGPATEVIDLAGPARDSRPHRGPRPLHGPRPVEADVST